MSWELIQQKAKQQVDECILIAKNIILQKYGKTFKEIYHIIDPSIAALYCAHESKGKPWVKTSYPEIGLFMLTGKYKLDDEIGRFNVFPLDPKSNIWGAQKSFEEGIRVVGNHLTNAGYNEFRKLFIGDQITLLLLPRAIGYGCTKTLLKRSFKAKFKNRPIIAITEYLSKDPNVTCGVQESDVVKLRFLWCSTMILRADEVGISEPLKEKELKSVVRRPDDIIALPEDWYTNTRSYILAAKRKGYQETGSWWEE
jgi:hypothetical protein